MKLVTKVWQWLERVAATHAMGSNRRPSVYITSRRREALRRAAGQIGTY
ncbi:MAG: hypothetical protein JOZ85_06805 [Betaproteobacteria bacterium]|nr:hypothetical protein [Betaproteobacteria bacterium]